MGIRTAQALEEELARLQLAEATMATEAPRWA